MALGLPDRLGDAGPDRRRGTGTWRLPLAARLRADSQNTAATAAKARISQNGVVLSQDFALPFPGLQTVECTHLAGTSPN